MLVFWLGLVVCMEQINQNNDSRTVVQGNKLIVSTSNAMKTNQLKILYFLMSCIKREDEIFFPIEVDYKTLLMIIDYDVSKGGKKTYLTELLEDMANKSYYLYAKDRITVYPWFGAIQIDRDVNTGRVVFKFNEDLSKYLLQQTRNFTQYQYGFISAMTSSHAIKLYNLLRSFEFCGTAEFTLTKFRQAMNFLNTKSGDDKYKDYKSLSKYVLADAVQKINSSTDITIQYEPIKSSEDRRKVVGVRFSITHNSSALAMNVPQIDTTLVENDGFDRPVRRVTLHDDK